MKAHLGSGERQTSKIYSIRGGAAPCIQNTALISHRNSQAFFSLSCVRSPSKELTYHWYSLCEKPRCSQNSIMLHCSAIQLWSCNPLQERGPWHQCSQPADSAGAAHRAAISGWRIGLGSPVHTQLERGVVVVPSDLRCKYAFFLVVQIILMQTHYLTWDYT